MTAGILRTEGFTSAPQRHAMLRGLFFARQIVEASRRARQAVSAQPSAFSKEVADQEG